MCAANSWTTETWMPYLFRSLLFVLYFSSAPHELFGRLWSVVLIDSNVGWDSFRYFIKTSTSSRILNFDEHTDIPQMLLTRLWSGLGGWQTRAHTSFAAEIEWNGPLRAGGSARGAYLKLRLESTTCVTRKNVEQKEKIPLLWVFPFYSIFIIIFFHMRNRQTTRWRRDAGSTLPHFLAFVRSLHKVFRMHL